MFWLYELSDEMTQRGMFEVDGNYDAVGFFLSRKLVTNSYIKNNKITLEENGWIKRDLLSKKFYLVANWDDNFENFTYVNVTQMVEKNKWIM
jgi:hypothetical protein